VKNNAPLMGAGFAVVLLMILRNKKPRGIRNNNPLNIRENGTKWNGRIGDDGAFVQFSNAAFGIRAAARILKNYRDKYGLDTVTGIISRWAPPIENDTQSYIDSVAQKTDVSANQALHDSDYENLIRAMIYHENGEQPYTVDIVKQGFNEGFYT
jgi:hypothetical protein